MVKSLWIVDVDVYDYFDYDGRLRRPQKRFTSLKEAFAYYKEEKKYDIDLGDHYQRTTIFHIFVFENEEKMKQEKIREERKRRREEIRRQEKLLKALKEAFLRSLDPDEWPKNIENPSSPEPELETYVFDKDDVIF